MHYVLLEKKSWIIVPLRLDMLFNWPSASLLYIYIEYWYITVVNELSRRTATVKLHVKNVEVIYSSSCKPMCHPQCLANGFHSKNTFFLQTFKRYYVMLSIDWVKIYWSFSSMNTFLDEESAKSIRDYFMFRGGWVGCSSWINAKERKQRGTQFAASNLTNAYSYLLRCQEVFPFSFLSITAELIY